MTETAGEALLRVTSHTSRSSHKKVYMKVLMAGKKHSNIKDLKEKAVCQNFFSSIPDQMPLNTVTQIFQRVNVTLEGFA